MDLAQQLLAIEAAPVGELQAALLLHANHALPFPMALREVSPSAWGRASAELQRRFGACVEATPPDAQLLDALPAGLCARLLAYPLGASASTAVVDVLAVDPLDALVASEFSHHLQRPVRVLRGDYVQVTARLSGLAVPSPPATKRQDVSQMNLDSRPQQHDSLPPIPLVRRAPVSAPRTTRGVAPPAHERARGVRAPVRVVAPRSGQAPDAHSALEHPSAQVADTTDLLHPGAVRLSLDASSSDDFDAALGQLAVAESPDQVVAALATGMAPLCEEVIVFAVRGSVLASRARLNYAGQVERFADLEVEPTTHCAVASALYDGQAMDAPTPDDLLLFVGQPGEVCATRVSVHEKPALVFAMGGFSDAFEVSRRAERLARAAADALGRIVRARKR